MPFPARPFILFAPAGRFIAGVAGNKKRLMGFVDYPVSRLKGKFLNAATRSEATGVYEAVLVE